VSPCADKNLVNQDQQVRQAPRTVASRLVNFGLQESEAMDLTIRKKTGEVKIATGPTVGARRAELPLGITSGATMLGKPVEKLITHSVCDAETYVTNMEIRAHVLMPNEKSERCGGDNPKTSGAKPSDDNPEPSAEAGRSAAFAPLTGWAIVSSNSIAGRPGNAPLCSERHATSAPDPSPGNALRSALQNRS
jgi:hypothetical protein